VRDAIADVYLQPEKPHLSDLKEIQRQCQRKGLRAPNFRTVKPFATDRDSPKPRSRYRKISDWSFQSTCSAPGSNAAWEITVAAHRRQPARQRISRKIESFLTLRDTSAVLEISL
jgi:hypothetical protein